MKESNWTVNYKTWTVIKKVSSGNKKSLAKTVTFSSGPFITSPLELVRTNKISNTTD